MLDRKQLINFKLVSEDKRLANLIINNYKQSCENLKDTYHLHDEGHEKGYHDALKDIILKTIEVSENVSRV